MIEIEMKMFGAFRKYQNQQIRLSFESPVSVDQIKLTLFKQLAEKLIFDSALANEIEVLPPDAILSQSCTLSILPPVCGG